MTASSSDGSAIPASSISTVIHGAHGSMGGADAPSPSSKKPRRRVETADNGVAFVVFMGIVLPVITLLVELSQGMSASIYLDPIPSSLHLAMVALVPIANLLVFMGAVNGWMRARYALGMINGVAIVAGVFYGLVYLPIAPFAIFAIVAFGIGFLPLSPIFGLLASVRCHLWLCDLRYEDESRRSRGFIEGVVLGVALLCAAEGSSIAVRLGLSWTQSTTDTVRQRGIWLMRTFARHDQLLMACYGMPTGITDKLFISPSDTVRTDQARQVYYQVTGNVFNSQPIPRSAQQRGWFMEPDSRFFFDEALGGEQVAAQVPGLSLVASRIDGVIENDAALGYIEWTMVFGNTSNEPREARSLVQLPKGAVVSRLTLWINDIEHEAAFGGSAQVRAAYQDVVVVRRRDPVLVTYAGNDRVMVQCFPVPAQGRMKIRMGITLPMQMEVGGKAAFALPGFTERNIQIDEAVKHSVWLEGQAAMRESLDNRESPMRAEMDGTGRHILRGEVSDHRSSGSTLMVAADRSSNVRLVWTEYDAKVIASAQPSPLETPDDPTTTRQAVVQTFEEKVIEPLKRIVIVVDGSASMRVHANAISEAIRTMSGGIETAVLIAGDQPQWCRQINDLNGATLAQAALAVREFDYIGGCDNLLALELAWDEAAAAGSDAAILWLHGPQPVIFRDIETLIQRMQRHRNGASIYSMQLAPGPNHIAAALASRDAFHSITHVNDLATHLKTLLTDWQQQTRRNSAVRSLSPLSTVQTPEAQAVAATHASQHLRRLWAYDEMLRLLDAGDQASREKAVELGKANQLVSPITGAVVLETQQQYETHGLKQGNPSNSPSVPEPNTALLFAVMGSLLATRRGRRREEA